MRVYIKYLALGIAWGCTWLVVMTVLLFIWSRSAFESLMADYPWQALGAVIVGVASTMPALVYSLQRMPYLWRFAIHMGIALPVFFVTAFALRWIPYYPESVWTTLLEILIGIGVFLAIWVVFYCINRGEARRINARVDEMRRGVERKG